MTNNIGLYVHVPFCLKRCKYCNFISNIFSEDAKERFLKDTIIEIERTASYYNHPKVDTIYFGGGTPSLLTPTDIEKIILAIYNNFNVSCREFTLELNPSSNNYMADYSSLGINRLSIGIQSLDDEVLSRLGRLHNSSQAIQTLENASRYFENISVDLMLGVGEGKTLNTAKTVDLLANYTKHFSCYILKVEEGTQLQKEVDKGTFLIPLEEQTILEYLSIGERLEQLGFLQYEISNFAKPYYQSIHNTKYWEREPYLGIGEAAHSFINNIRFNGFLQNIETIDRDGEITETLMLSTRMNKGLDLNRFKEKFQYDLLSSKAKEIEKISKYIQIDDNILSFTKEGLLIQNTLLSFLI